MTDKIDHARLLRQYVGLIRSRFRSDQLDEFSGICAADRSEIRRIADATHVNAVGPAVERVGGTTVGDPPHGRSWFSELNNAPHEDKEAECAWRSEA